MEGWIKLHRKITQSAVFSDPDLLRLWMLCLTKATHKGYTIMVERKQVSLAPGEFLTGRKSLTDDYNMGLKPRFKKKELSLWRDLKFLEECGNLNIKTTNKYSVISITKWGEYQESEQQLNNNRTTSEQQLNTNKNVKKENNEKDPRPKPEKRVYDEDSIPYRSANYLLTNILLFKPDLKRPNLQSWADDMRKLIELDGRDPKEVGDVIQWVTKDPFWHTVILSASNLRDKWDKITAKMKEKGKQPGKTVIQLPTVQTTDEERAYLAEIRRKQAEHNGVSLAKSE